MKTSFIIKSKGAQFEKKKAQRKVIRVMSKPCVTLTKTVKYNHTQLYKLQRLDARKRVVQNE